MLYEKLTDLIGNTPLVRVPFQAAARCYAKLEYLNPGGSIKDRAAHYMITQAEKSGLLKPGGTIIEASSGNQGISTALIASLKGYKVIVTVSEKVSTEKRATLTAYGATVITCPPTTYLNDPASYHTAAVEIHKATPNSFFLNQYFNPDNPQAHYHGLGPDIWQQTQGKITHFIAAAGSGGTISGAGAYLKEQSSSIQIIGVDAATSYRTTKGAPQPYQLEGMGVDYETPLLNMDVIDKIITVTDQDALATLRHLAHQYGFLVGPASGAVAYAAQQITATASANSLIVMLFGDSGRAYLTKQFFVEEPDKKDHLHTPTAGQATL